MNEGDPNQLTPEDDSRIRRLYKEKVGERVTIECEMGQYKISPNNALTHHFIDRRLLNNIEILRLKDENAAAFANFIQYLKRLTSIKFSFGNFNESFGYHINDYLANIENVDFKNCNGEINFYNDILMHCTRLKRLRIDSPNWENIPIDTYASLEVFEYFVYNEAAMGVLNEFVVKNQSIKRIVCYFVNRVIFYSGEAMNSLLRFLVNAKNIDEIFLDFWGDCDFGRIAEALDLMGERDGSKRMVFKYNPFNKKNFERLASVNILTELCFDSYAINTESIETLSSFRLIKSLRLGHFDYNNCDKRTIRLSLEHPNLEELHLDGASLLSFSWSVDVKSLLLPFVRNSAKLKRLFVVNTPTCDKNNLLPTFNEIREQLNDACPMTIFVDKAVYHHLANSIRLLNRGGDLVRIKVYELAAIGQNFDYPFRNYTVRELGN